MPTATITMTDPQFEKLRKIIYERSGICFQANKKYVLESRLAQRLFELEIDDYDQYASFLTIGPYKDDEFQEMFNRITINETSFFRNEPQLDIFESKVLPAVIEARASTNRLRLWSAACSSGEEPYTLAIMVQRTLGIRLLDWRVEILGTDISEKVLDAAQQGRYSNYAVRNTNPMVVKKYFTDKQGSYQLNDDIRSMVTFELHNLRDAARIRRHGLFDVIFCRNVMIYFDDDMKQRCLSLFESMLAPDGHLFIGHSETLRGLQTRLHPSPVPQAFCYHKRALSNL